MADFKKRMFVFASGKQIKLYGNSFAIGRNLEIGEGAAPNIFAEQTVAVSGMEVTNPYQLTQEELMELADYNIQLWMDLKSNLRKFGVGNAKVFAPDISR